jgi:hypothetical protein
MEGVVWRKKQTRSLLGEFVKRFCVLRGFRLCICVDEAHRAEPKDTIGTRRVARRVHGGE